MDLVIPWLLIGAAAASVAASVELAHHARGLTGGSRLAVYALAAACALLAYLALLGAASFLVRP